MEKIKKVDLSQFSKKVFDSKKSKENTIYSFFKALHPKHIVAILLILIFLALGMFTATYFIYSLINYFL